MSKSGTNYVLEEIPMEQMRELLTQDPSALVYGMPRYVSTDGRGNFFVYPLPYRIIKEEKYV